MNDPRSIAVIVVLTLAAAGSWYVSQLNQSEEADAAPVEPVLRGYFLEDARIFGTGLDGELLYEIVATRAEQNPDKTVAFSDVNIRYAEDSRVPWHLDADTAVIDPAKPVIQLRGSVSAFSTSGLGGEEMEVRTDYLELDPDRFIAQTDERVQIRIGPRSLTATGMLASLKDNELELKSNVSGKFVP